MMDKRGDAIPDAVCLSVCRVCGKRRARHLIDADHPRHHWVPVTVRYVRAAQSEADRAPGEVDTVAKVIAAEFGYEWVFESDTTSEHYDAAYWRHVAGKALDALRSEQGQSRDDTVALTEVVAFLRSFTSPASAPNEDAPKMWLAADVIEARFGARDDTVTLAERLQAAVDKAYAAMNASQYVGGPTEREAWQTATTALQEVVTQHKGAGRAEGEDRDTENER